MERRVADDLHDAPSVGHDQGKVGGELDLELIAAAGVEEAVLGLVHQARDVGRLRGYRERAGLDARHVEEIAHEAAHVLGLVVDDAEELAHLGGVQAAGIVQERAGRALDRGQRYLQLVADHGQELRPQPIQLLERREVLHGDHERHEFALGGVDGGRVHESGDRPAVGNVHDDLLGPDRLRRGECLRHGELLQRELPAVGAVHAHDPQQIGGVLPRLLQRADDALRLAVDRLKVAAACIEHGNPDRGRVDERLQVAAGVLLVAVAAGISDHAGGLGGEGHERLFVLAAELGIGLLLREADGAETLAAVPDGGPHEGARVRERAETARPMERA